MRRYVCPSCRGTCRCGRRSSDPLAGLHASGAAVIAMIFALGGTVRLLIWAVPHPSHWWSLILLTALVIFMARSRHA